MEKVSVHAPSNRVTFNQIMEILRQDQGYVDVGATAGFTGIVRGVARDGKQLSAVEIIAEPNTLTVLEQISKETEAKHDIVQQCAIHVHTGKLEISEPLMFVCIAGTQGPERVPELFDIIVAVIERIKREARIRLAEALVDGESYITAPKDSSKSFD